MQSRTLALGFTALMVSFSASQAASQAVTERQAMPGREPISIEAQPLSLALKELARKLDIQFVYVGNIESSLVSAPVAGASNATTALAEMLDGTSVDFRFVDQNTVVIEGEPTSLNEEDKALAALGDGAFALEDYAQVSTPASGGSGVEEGSAAAIDSASAPALEEIIVTARKREESLQDVPISVNAFSNTFINEAGLTSVFDVADYTPNLSFRESFGRTFDRPVIRGMSNIIGGANAGVFINGIFVPGTISNAELTNVERVEVIKGPQAALFGRATFAGAINYVIRRPSDEYEGRLLATVAEDGEQDYSGFLSGPIIENELFFMASARWFEMDGQYDNIGTGGGSAGGLSSNSFNLSLLWTPSEDLDVMFRVAYSEDDDDHIPFRLQTSDNNNCFPNSRRGYFCGEVNEFEEVALNLDVLPNAGLERDTLRSNLMLNWDLGFATFTSVTSYTEENTETRRDNDFLDTTQNPLIFLPFLSVEAFRTYDQSELEDFSQELRLSSDQSRRLRWLTGLYYYQEKLTGRSGAGLAIDNPLPVAPNEVQNFAAFGSLEYDFTDQLTMTAELRYAEDEIEAGTVSVGGGGTVFGTVTESFDSLTPRVTLSYDLSEDLMLFANVSKGNKPGGINTALQASNISDEERARLAAFNSFDEEEAWNYEFGVKGSALDGRLRFDAAVFYIDWTEQQLSTSEPVEREGSVFSTVPLIVNAAATEVKGLEISVQARPTGWLDLGATYGYVNAEFKEYDDPEQEDLFGDPSAAGNNTPNAPEHTAAAWGVFHFPLTPDIDGQFRIDYFFESSRYAQIHNLAETGDTERVNARLRVESGPWSATLFGRNLLQDRTPNSVTRFLDPETLFSQRAFGVALPRLRQIGLSLQYDL